MCKLYVFPVRPSLDLIVERCAGAGGCLRLAMAEQRVVAPQVAALLGQLNEILGILQHLWAGRAVLKVANEDNADALAIVAGRMGALQSEAAALVHFAIAGNNEVVADVAELAATLVVRLYGLDHALALLWRAASIGIVRVMDDHKLHSAIDARGRTRTHCAPTAAGFNGQRLRRSAQCYKLLKIWMISQRSHRLTIAYD